ncbi:MAG: LPS-assembly protein LptD [Bacteriovoracaceae bacterium]
MSFQVGDEVNVYSDKAYKMETINKLVGNVVITHGEETLYGESATIDLANGHIEVEGNIRLVSDIMTVYGSKLSYDMKTQKIIIENARVIAETYSLVGKSLSRISESVFIAEEAEYTTCKDCPESWSVYGKNVKINVNEYVHVKGAMIKINGVNIIYLPYLLLPIKNERQTGLLFPSFSLFNREGVSYQQPFFWAVSKSADMTLTPSTWGRRGYGTDFEYRQLFGQEKWVNYNARVLQDKIYQPNKATTEQSTTATFRQFGEYEHHFQFANWGTHHSRYTTMKDLDLVKVFRAYTDPKIQGSEVGFSGFFDGRIANRLSLSVQGDYNQNQLVSDPLLFDKSYVQVLPSTNLSMIPWTLYTSSVPMLQNIAVGGEVSHTMFRQQAPEENTFLRNADRVNFTPYLDWNLADVGPVHLKTRYGMDYQHYEFKTDNNPSFQKQAGTIVSEANFEVDRIFGLSYNEKVDIERINPNDLKRMEEKKISEQTVKPYEKNNNLIGALPSFNDSLTEDFVLQSRNSYRHSQEFKMKHFYTTESTTKGNGRFYNQIQDVKGLFDYNDSIRTKENNLGSNLTRTIISPSNTVELQWNNTLVKKTSRTFNTFQDGRYLRDNFEYRRLGYFNVSQGYELNTDRTHFNENLTRLLMTTGYVMNKTTLSFSDYYFYTSSNHILQTTVMQGFDRMNVFTSLNVNMFDTPATEIVMVGGNIRPIDILNFYTKYDYNYNSKEPINALYGVDYIPRSNCWRLNLNLNRSVVEQRIAFNILVNFSDNTFTPLNSSTTNTLPSGASSQYTGSPDVKTKKPNQ